MVIGGGWPRQDSGQSLVELALVLPVLLIILLGIGDLGRAFYYTTAAAAAAREGAAYAAGASPADATILKSKACAATGLDPTGDCGTALAATDVTSRGCDSPTPSGSVAVEVTYNFTFITSYLVNRVFPAQSLLLRACATYPRLTS